MGVPNILKWLTKSYPEIIQFNQNKQVDSLYFDWTNVIYNCAKNMATNSTEDELISETLKYLDELIKLIKPKKLIYIAIDGVSPLALLNYQRLKQFKKMKEIDEINILREKFNQKIENKWDCNSINPGTKFLHKLCKKTIHYIKKYNNLQVIVSSAQDPLPGKDKIVNYFSKNPKNTTVIYSSNLELLTQILSSDRKNIYLLNKKQYIDINLIKKKIVNYFEEKTNYVSKNKQTWIDDFVFISLILDNQYLPNIPCLLCQYDGISRILNSYITTQKKFKKHLVHPNTKEINVKFLIDMLKSIATKETVHFQDNYKKDRYTTGKAPKHYQGYEKAMYEYMNLAKERTTDFVQLGKSNWKSRYYRHYFGIEDTDKNSIHQICKMYLQGISWAWKYLRIGVPSWNWYYPFHQAPHLSDLVYVMRQVNLNRFKFKKNAPIHAFNQLLAILPKNSIQLLPDSYKCLMHSNSTIADFYPIDFRQDFIQKEHRDNGIPLIPFVDFDRLIEATKGLPLSKEEKERNKLLGAFNNYRRHKKN